MKVKKAAMSRFFYDLLLELDVPSAYTKSALSLSAKLAVFTCSTYNSTSEQSTFHLIKHLGKKTDALLIGYLDVLYLSKPLHMRYCLYMPWLE